MRSLWAYIEGMDGLSLRFTATNSSDLAALARFVGTLTLSKRCLLLQYDLVLPNSSTHVATLYLGPMRSLWAYIEGMDGLHLLFMRANSSNLGLPGPVLALCPLQRTFALLLCIWMPLISPKLVATLYLGPMRSLWAYIEGMDGLHLSFSRGQTAPIWLPGPGLALWLSSKVFAPPECVGASQFFYACCNIVFGTHEKPLGIY